MPDTHQGLVEGSGAGTVRRTLVALGIAWHRRDTRVVILAVGVGYLLVYLVTVGDLAFVADRTRPPSIRTVDDLARGLASVGFFRFAAIAIVAFGPITYLFSPLNLALSIVLASLVSANFALAYLGLVQPRACGLESSTGVLAGIPALLSGAACCGPTILLVIGVQASATIITGFQLLVPVALVMLVGGLLLIGRQIDPNLL